MPKTEEIALPHTFECHRCDAEMRVTPSELDRPDHVTVETSFSNFGWSEVDDGVLCGSCTPGGSYTCSTCGAENSGHRTRCSQCHEPL